MPNYNFSRLEYLDMLIRRRATGDPKTLAKKMNISLRATYDYIDMLKSLGAPIIGLVVVLGLIVDDPILKVETLNRIMKKYELKGVRLDEQLLKKIIHEAGDICLKPLLMVSLTTSVAMVPVFFVGGIGNDLQKPMALCVIGGLTLGTFFTTWFIPLSYWYIIKLRKFGK